MYKEPKCLLLSITKDKLDFLKQTERIQYRNEIWIEIKIKTTPVSPVFQGFFHRRSPDFICTQSRNLSCRNFEVFNYMILRKMSIEKLINITSQIKQTTSHYFCACNLSWVDWKPIAHENSFGIKFKITAVLVAISGNVWAVPNSQIYTLVQ